MINMLRHPVFFTGFFDRSIKWVCQTHSLRQSKPIKFIKLGKKRPQRLPKRLPKSHEKAEDQKPVVYMRAVIENISRILRFSTWALACEQLENLSIKWDSFTINQVLKSHPPMEKAWLFFDWCSHLKGFKHDQFTYTTMLDIFGEAGRISSMKYLLNQMEEKGIKIDTVTYTSVLHWLSKDGDIDGSLNVWKEIKNKGLALTVVSYTAFMKVLFDHNRPKEAAAVYREMIEAGCSPNCYTYTVLVEYLAGSGNFKAAFDILTKMQEVGIQPDRVACTILVQKCSEAGKIPVLSQTLLYMKENSLILRRPIYLKALAALNMAGKSENLLREVNPHFSLEGSIEEANSFNIHPHIDRDILINLLAQRNFVAVERLLEGIMEKNVQLDATLIATIIREFCANFSSSGAWVAFEYGRKAGLNLERAAYINLIGFFMRHGLHEKVVEIVEEMGKMGVLFGTYLVSILILRLGSIGMPSFCERIFYSLPGEQNNVTYTALMDAQIKSGFLDKALELYSSMIRHGISASSGTFEVLGMGLEGAGRSHEAEIFRKQQKKLACTGYHKGLLIDHNLCSALFDNGYKVAY